MDKMDELLFSAAREQTSGMDFQASWDAIEATAQKKRTRRVWITRATSMAAMLAIGFIGGMFARAAVYAPAPEVTPVPTQSVSPATPEPEPPDIVVDPPKTDGGFGEFSWFESDRAFPDIPESGDIEALLPAWLPEGFRAPMVLPLESRWASNRRADDRFFYIDAFLTTAFHLTIEQAEGLKIGEGRLRISEINDPVYTNGAYTPQLETRYMYEWCIRVSADYYLVISFGDGISQEDTVKVVESIRKRK